jgi:VCBS repeat-containing protein
MPIEIKLKGLFLCPGPVSWKVVSGPTNGNLSGSGSDLVYTPDENYNGQDTFTFTVNDGELTSDPATIRINVMPVNDAPVAVDDIYSTSEETELNLAAPGVLDNDTDVEGDPLTAVLDTDVEHGTLTLNSDGSFTYMPDADFNGEDSFTYKANDGDDDSEAAATVTITVTSVDDNDAPVAVDDTYTTTEGVQLNVNAPGVLLNDTDADGNTLTVNISLSTGVSNGTLNLFEDGSFTYTPDVDFTGIDSFTYVASDGEYDSDPATVTITVQEDGMFYYYLPLILH